MGSIVCRWTPSMLTVMLIAVFSAVVFSVGASMMYVGSTQNVQVAGAVLFAGGMGVCVAACAIKMYRVYSTASRLAGEAVEAVADAGRWVVDTVDSYALQPVVTAATYVAQPVVAVASYAANSEVLRRTPRQWIQYGGFVPFLSSGGVIWVGILVNFFGIFQSFSIVAMTGFGIWVLGLLFLVWAIYVKAMLYLADPLFASLLPITARQTLRYRIMAAGRAFLASVGRHRATREIAYAPLQGEVEGGPSGGDSDGDSPEVEGGPSGGDSDGSYAEV